ncbi:MAG: hypothetical protein NC938_04140 [Candidatus Omnitrophica bacterium]|nr:hypothetical protein [Candidatus Omnitrophota bacterium]
MKKIACLLVAFALVVGMTGCDAVQRKFTRKPKTTKMPRIYQVKKYEKTPSPELYSKHFAYWQSWQSEIIQSLGENAKKDRRCMDEILMQLGDMQNMLVKEKADELGKHIARLRQIRDTIYHQQIDRYNRGPVLTELEKQDRLIKKDFSVSKIKNYLKKSFDEEPAAEVEEGK